MVRLSAVICVRDIVLNSAPICSESRGWSTWTSQLEGVGCSYGYRNHWVLPKGSRWMVSMNGELKVLEADGWSAGKFNTPKMRRRR